MAEKIAYKKFWQQQVQELAKEKIKTDTDIHRLETVLVDQNVRK